MWIGTISLQDRYNKLRMYTRNPKAAMEITKSYS